MRLLRIDPNGNLSLVERSGSDIPPYAVLSHTWGKDEDEVTFKDWNDGISKSKAGYQKIHSCGEQAARDCLEYFWIDTLCIDKSSSAELSEAINSMFLWYQEADVCYAYLDDVPSKKSFSDSRWFTRGWTLQELVAPEKVEFFDGDWNPLGSRTELQEDISQCTGIPTSLLSGAENLEAFSIAQKMSWAAKRQTKRVEDRAYSLLGIFYIHMPLIYGEGENAFVRLQEEIMKISEDHSIFAWRSTDDRCGCLATSPDSFSDSGDIVFRDSSNVSSEPVISARGIHLEVPLVGDPRGGRQGFVILNCYDKSSENRAIATCVRDLDLTMKRFERVHSHEFSYFDLQRLKKPELPVRRICIQTGRIRRVRRTRIPGKAVNIPFRYTNPQTGSVYSTVSEAHNTLLEAVKDQSEDAVWWYLVNQETDVNAVDDYGRSALSQAAIGGSENIMRMLLGREEIDINKKDNLMRSPLSLAAENGHTTLVELLLTTGRANVNSRNRRGETPLLLAAAQGHKSVVQVLLEEDEVDLDSESSDRQTPLSYAASKGHTSIVKMLLQTRAVNINYRGERRETPLSMAVANGHEAVVKLLVEAENIDLNHLNTNYRTPLSIAACNGHESIVKLLLQAGCIQVHSYSGLGGKYLTPKEEIVDYQAPLTLAAENGHVAIVKLLLEFDDIRFHLKSRPGKIVLSRAVKNGHAEMVDVFEAKQEEIDAERLKNQMSVPLLERGRKTAAKLMFKSDKFVD